LLEGGEAGEMYILIRLTGARVAATAMSFTVALLADFWPITLLLATVWLGVFIATPARPSRSKFDLLFRCCGPAFACPLAIMIIGEIFANSRLDWPQFVMFAFLLANAPLAVVITVKRPGVRAAVVMSSVLATYVSLAAFFICSMLVSGTWL
jgi:hypothetical protein